MDSRIVFDQMEGLVAVSLQRFLIVTIWTSSFLHLCFILLEDIDDLCFRLGFFPDFIPEFPRSRFNLYPFFIEKSTHDQKRQLHKKTTA
jgi:hypothetical protein